MFFGKIDTAVAIDSILAHSLSLANKRIRKGTVLTSEHIELLLESGIDTVTVAQLDENDVNEDLAAESIAKELAGYGIRLGKASTGRVNCYAKWSGLLSLPTTRLMACNGISESITVSTLAENRWVEAGKLVATIKIIPYAVDQSLLDKAIEAGAYSTSHKSTSINVSDNLSSQLNVHQPRPRKAYLVHTLMPTTSSSITDKTTHVTNRRLRIRHVALESVHHCQHRIEDLADILRAIIAESSKTERSSFSDDSPVNNWILLSGASAISDREDVIPRALTIAGGSIIRFGIPVDPGNLLMIGELHGHTVIGIPGCARSPKPNGLDLFLDRLCCELPISDHWINSLAIGGLRDEIVERPQPRSPNTNQNVRPLGSDSKPPSKVVAILLAAGRSKRFGKANKLIAEHEGSALIDHTLHTIIASKIDQLLIVLGHEPSMIENHCRNTIQSLNSANTPAVEFVYNSDYESGMGSSLKCGISSILNSHIEINEKLPAAMVFLSDMPSVKTQTIDSLLDATYKAIDNLNNSVEPAEVALIPTHQGTRGNPVLLMPALFDSILDLSGDFGARHLLNANPDAVKEVPVDDPGILIDYDTPDQFVKYSR